MNFKDWYDARKWAGYASRGEVEALDPENELHLEAINRFNQLIRLPLTTAIREIPTGRVFYNASLHGNIQDKNFENYGKCQHDTIEFGFLHDDGRFLDRAGASMVAKDLDSPPMADLFMGGEEWVPPLKNEAMAEVWASNMHYKGYEQALSRIALFEHKQINLEYVRLLRIATDSYPVSEEASRYGNG